MRQALISLLIYVVPLPVVYAYIDFVASATITFEHPHFTTFRYHLPQWTRVIQWTFWWCNGSFASILSLGLIGLAAWAVHQAFRGAALVTLRRTHLAF
jgi:hypothetical protein